MQARVLKNQLGFFSVRRLESPASTRYVLELYETSGWRLLLGSLTVGIADKEKPQCY